ncbi:hypothetical protein [Streptomyces lonegramiae]|uniref:Uncharacterized protein n=1 Tax=Streptomyces lonegramiae TaxID=3075524 RepID=A0ABU2XPT3_9ACTN|nr:hypothetical protein [Streptomyces sp. DSM 41529]MDT0547921.1 hypothetical protein [Streptomyces sp. DSM 41529]
MSQTLIALVGAGGAVAGALAGALATGLLGIKVARTQLASQREIQALDLQEQHRIRHREISRAAYVDLINKTNKAMKWIIKILHCRITDIDTLENASAEMNSALNEVLECIPSVELEGERVAIDRATLYRKSLEDTSTLLAELMQRLTTPHTLNLLPDSKIIDIDTTRSEAALAEIRMRRSDFMDSARSALGNNDV